MKLLTKFAILAVFLAFVSSCQKETLPVPATGTPIDNAATHRGTVPNTAGDAPSITGDDNPGVDEIVGGGDDDRDGGGKKKPGSSRMSHGDDDGGSIRQHK